MENLLLLVHRIPFPPNKGDKIRSYHLLRHLAKQYRVFLATFVDDPEDWQHVDTVRALCADALFVPLDPLRAKIGSLRGLLANRALSLDYYRSSALQDWVDERVKREAISRALVFSSSMAQFVPSNTRSRVIDFVDIDSDKWAQYAKKKSFPMNWLYQRESRTLLAYEREIAGQFDASLFVSQAEANLFKTLAPESVEKIDFFNNGVDTDYFTPDLPHSNPYSDNEQAIVFTGAMDYWPNIDAVNWFAQEVFPSVRAQHPQASFVIVGARPTPEVRALEQQAGIRVTGTVPDVRPYLAHARVAVAPLRIARGIQNKVLEAMAMSQTVIVSPQALEGIHAQPGSELIRADDAIAYATSVNSILTQAQPDIGRRARQKVLNDYGWDANLARVDELIEQSQPAIQ